MVDAKLTTRDGLGIPFQFSDSQQFEKAQKECKYQGVTLEKGRWLLGWLTIVPTISQNHRWIPTTQLM